jgi:hypothetical protein
MHLRPWTRDLAPSGLAGLNRSWVGHPSQPLHRAAHLARTHPNARVLLTTFSDTLANALSTEPRSGCTSGRGPWLVAGVGFSRTFCGIFPQILADGCP